MKRYEWDRPWLCTAHYDSEFVFLQQTKERVCYLVPAPKLISPEDVTYTPQTRRVGVTYEVWISHVIAKFPLHQSRDFPMLIGGTFLRKKSTNPASGLQAAVNAWSAASVVSISDDGGGADGGGADDDGEDLKGKERRKISGFNGIQGPLEGNAGAEAGMLATATSAGNRWRMVSCNTGVQLQFAGDLPASQQSVDVKRIWQAASCLELNTLNGGDGFSNQAGMWGGASEEATSTLLAD
ncbi:hypothetical protein R3P38DRAFT_2812038 [Favolaschia claudopus]|uniref:Uncharacterized protein n=1 Tax=Favolaschia claudopus TaxID=2862362 RepID=A0AAV9Z7E4_9AGAR